MTPMVDVAFLLLIFFMSTTQFKPPEQVSVSLPASSSEIKVPETEVIVITVTKQGKFFIGDETGKATEIAEEDLARTVLEERVRNRAARVIVKGDKETEFGLIADVMYIMQHTNTNRFNLMTELRTEQYGTEPAAEGAQAAQ
ncbi:MAG: biopolymer transporter ExbD [Candidatus Eisenbacteria bacterium]|nr:biopolymer transporter ExbD [Candidatus Eisenbacteria bacterium]